MNTFQLTIASPDGNYFKGEIQLLSVRGSEGNLAIMAGHIPFVTTVKSCDCKIKLDDGTEKIGHTEGGMLSVSKDRVLLLSGTFKWL